MPHHPTQGPSAWETGSLIWLNHGAVDPRRAPFPQAHFPSLSHSSVKVGSSRPQLHAICTQARRRAVTVLTTTYHLRRRSICPRSWHSGVTLRLSLLQTPLLPQWDWLGAGAPAGGRATTLIPQGPAVPTAGIPMVIHITADPPPSKLGSRHRVSTPAGAASPSTSPSAFLPEDTNPALPYHP